MEETNTAVGQSLESGRRLLSENAQAAQGLMEKLQEFLVLYGLRIIAAIIILIIGRMIASGVRNVLGRVMDGRKVDPTVTRFVTNFTYVLILTFAVIAALTKVGIETTSFIAVVGAAGLAIGLALQGALANFAAGFLLILFRHFKAGDYIEGGGTAGIIEEIQVFTTIMKTPDNKMVIVPNAKLTSDNIINYSAHEFRRLDIVFGVSYTDDIRKVKDILLRVAGEDERVLKEPAPVVVLSNLGDSSVDFTWRVWVKVSDYWAVNFDTMEKVKMTFDAEGVSIPFPQRDVHLFQER